jgi:hypothetical protein
LDRGRIAQPHANRRIVDAMLDFIDDAEAEEAESRITSAGRDRVTLLPRAPAGDPG